MLKNLFFRKFLKTRKSIPFFSVLHGDKTVGFTAYLVKE